MKKYNIDFIKNDYLINNFNLLDEYKNSNIRMNYICLKCNYKHFKSYTTFRKNKFCKNCSSKYVKNDKDFVIEYLKKENYTLDSEYINMYTKFNSTCDKGHSIKIRFNDFKNMNRRCPKCSGNQNIENDEIINKLDKYNFDLLSEYKNNHSKLKIRCRLNNHIFERALISFNQGYINCPKCKKTTFKIKFDEIKNMINNEN